MWDLIVSVPDHCFSFYFVSGMAPINNKAIPVPLGCGSIRTRNGYQVALAMQVDWFNLEYWHCFILEY